MLRRFDIWWLALLSLLAVRLVMMAMIPLMDTSEPRYAEIARTMLTTGDWITPWFEPGIPFWGKPPLSFWGQAVAMQLGGVNELTVRMPSLLATVFTLVLLYQFAQQMLDKSTARLTVLMCASAVLMWVDAGAVITDPFLTLGVTLSVVAFAMAQSQPGASWRYGFFVGLAIGLLAKGPLAVVLIGFPVLVWWWRCEDKKTCLSVLPWVRGSLLTAGLTLPWYIAAELKTPGFLHYFIVGEHVLRFLDPGWRGDLYGNAHQRPHGIIWGYLVVAALPWSLAFIGLGAYRLVRRSARPVGQPLLHWYLLAWSSVCGLLFTPAGNILPTYVQPSLPAFCLLTAWWMRLAMSDKTSGGESREPNEPGLLPNVAYIAMLMAVMMGCTGVWANQRESSLKTEKSLVAYYHSVSSAGAPLVYLDRRPYSARFYSRGHAYLLDAPRLAKFLSDTPDTVHVAVAHHTLDALNRRLPVPLSADFRNKRYALITLRANDAYRFEVIKMLAQT